MSEKQMVENPWMHVTARDDYATRAAAELVDSSQERPSKMDAVAQAQGIPPSFLENILKQLRSAGVVRSRRGPEGGYWLARPPDELNVAPIIRAIEEPLVGVRGQRREEIEYVGSAESLQQVWIALRANLRKVLGMACDDRAREERSRRGDRAAPPHCARALSGVRRDSR
jgi:Rrf2 family protein